jgi:glycosyltransferase involved in cell wall biosynthesis
VRLFHHDQNRGKGSAVRTALEHAQYEFAAVLDADLEYRASDLGPAARASPASAGERRLRDAGVDV